MTPTTYQKPEIRDANDNIIQQGAFGKNTALCNATNNGWIDYVMNNLEFLYDLAKDEVVPVPALPASGQTNKTYLLTTTGVSYRWSGTQWVAVSSSEAVGRAEAAANLAEQWATKTDGTVDGTEYSAKYYAEQAEASADDAQDVADDMADHLVQIDKNTGGVAKNSKRISNIEKLLQGNLYDYDTDDDVAYTKTVPSGALPYAGLEKVGGKTIVWNQLCSAVTFPVQHSENGATTTWSGDAVTYSGTTTSTSWLYVAASNTIPADNHKYLALTDNVPTGYRFGVLKGNGSFDYTADNTPYHFYTNTLGINAINYRIPSGATVNFTAHLMLFDLTSLYGLGNEPSTVAEFEAMFPADYYEYNAGTLLSAGVTEVVSQGRNYLPLPASMNPLTNNGITVTPHADGSFTIVGTATQNATIRWALAESVTIPQDSYIHFRNSVSNGSVTFPITDDNNVMFVAPGCAPANRIVPVSAYAGRKIAKFGVYVVSGQTVNMTIQPSVEQSSTATDYTPYKAPIQYPVPAEIQALEGYGWSAGTAYNYIDFERKVFVKRVDRVVLDGTQTISLSNWRPLTNSVGWAYSISTPANAKKPSTNAEVANVLTDKLPTTRYSGDNNIYSTDAPAVALDSGTVYGLFVRVADTSLTTASAINTYLAANPITVYYELVTPVETDISQYLTDNLIEVGAGGTLTFPNANGDDYHIPVPSEVTYMIDLQEAIENGN